MDINDLTPEEPTDPTPSNEGSQPADAGGEQAAAVDVQAEPTNTDEELGDDADGWLRRTFFDGEDPSEDIAAGASALRRSDIGKWSDDVRSQVRLLSGRLLAERTKAMAAVESERATIAADRAAFEAERKRLARERAAFLQAQSNPDTLARLREQVEKRPKAVDATDPESIVAEATARIAERELAARAPAAEEAQRHAQAIQRDALYQEHGLDYADKETRDAVNARMMDRFGSIERIQETTEFAARTKQPHLQPLAVVLSEMRAEARAKAAADERAAQMADRARAGAALATGGVSGGTPRVSDADLIARVEADPNFDFTTAFRQNPAYREALNRATSARP